ncbi:helix-turn-helix transcriptional regulator [bacterium]|nr:helix-turn-helix transcriptional regulator [bacterium]
MEECDIKIKFGLRLRQLRKEKGISQEELMAATGIHRTYLSEVERGIRNISIVNVEKISLALNIDVMEMFNFQRVLKQRI